MGAEATLEAQMREFGLEEQDGKTKGYGGFRWDSPEQLAAVKAHRKLAWDWATSMGLSVFKQGLNLTKVSMPVAFFEDRSFLERMAENWAYLDLLKAAAREKDPVERMRCVVAFAIAGLVRQCSHGKPFNPLLGETLQAELDGVQLFAEQISHHPPISSWQMFDKDGLFRFQGHGEWRAKTYANSVEGVQKGVNRVTFKVDGSSIEWELPGMTLYGIIMGDRYMKYQGTMTFRDQQNGLQADIEIDPPREGGLLGAASRWWSGADDGWSPDMLRGEIKRNGTPVDSISGSWLTHITWAKAAGGKPRTYVDVRKAPVRSLVKPPGDASLPSDCGKRADLVALRSGDMEKAQAAKTDLEEKQRAEKRLREAAGVRDGE